MPRRSLDQKSIAGILAELEQLRKDNKILATEPHLERLLRETFSELGIADKFDPSDPGKIETTLKGLKTNDLEVLADKLTQTETAEEPEAPAVGTEQLNKAQLDALLKDLDDFEKHKSLKDPKTAARKIQQDNPLLARVNPTEILKIVERKAEIEAQESAKRASSKPEERVDEIKQSIKEKISEDKIKELSPDKVEHLVEALVSAKDDKEVEQILEESDIDNKSLEEEIAKTVKVEKESSFSESVKEEINLRISTEEKLKNSLGNTADETEIEKIAEEVAEIVMSEPTIKEAEERITEVLNENQIKDSQVREEVIETTADFTAVKEVEEKISQISDSIVEEIADVVHLSEEQETAILEVVSEKVTEKIMEPNSELNEFEAIISKLEGKVEAGKGNNLTDEVLEIIGTENEEVKDSINEIIDSGNVLVENAIVKEAEDNGVSSDGGLIPATNKEMPTDRFRAQKLREEIYTRVMERGGTPEQAKDMADFVCEIQFPENEESSSLTEFVAQDVLRMNKFVGGESVIGEARIIKNFLRSPKDIGKSIDKISGMSNTLKGIKGFDQVNNVVQKVKQTKDLTKSLQLVQKFVQFQDTVSKFTGGISTQIGNLLGVDALKEFGVSLATRLGGQEVGNMATQLMAANSFEEGVMSIVGQLFTKASVSAVEAGAEVGAEAALEVAGSAAIDGAAAAAGATGVGVPIALILLAVQATLMALQAAGKAAEGLTDKVMDGVGAGSRATKEWLQDNLGEGMGKVLYYGGNFAMFLLALPMGAAMFVFAIALVVPLVIGGIAGLSEMTASTVSSWVAPKGITGGYCIKQSEINAPSSDSLANCNPNAPVTDAPGVNKSKFVNVAEMWRAGGGKNAERCYYDVVCRAKNAGVDPDFALWAWLHESGASNYDGFSPTKLEDFGIHTAPGVGKNNFQQQAGYFMQYAASGGGMQHCVGNPLITAAASGTDAYWLAVSSWYLNGTCDPTVKNPANGYTAWDYLAELKTTWSWINSGGLPASMNIPTESCGGGTPSTNTNEDTGGNTYICEQNTTNPIPGTEVPANPIYDDNCVESPAYCVVDYLTKNGVTSVTRANVSGAENLINQWQNAPAGFNKAHFNSSMAASVAAFDGFQCVGFAVAVNPAIGATSWGGTVASWLSMIAQGSAQCPRIQNSGAGVGDFVLFPSGDWFHIQVISKLNPGGAYSISQANWGGLGRLSNVNGNDLQGYLSNKSVLRCN